MGSSRNPARADSERNLLLELLEAALQAELRAPAVHLCVGLSGGRDSMVLLHLLGLLRARAEFQLSAVHVNHQLQPQSEAWERFCAEQCARRSIRFQVHRIELGRERRDNLECRARELRYRVFAGLDCTCVVLAHHQQDQAETLLIQLMRGAGLAGLSAMAGSGRFQDGSPGPGLARPLLEVPSARLALLARQERLAWVEDPSNADTSLVRNFLRHELGPQLAQRFPGWAQALARSAGHLASAQELLQELAFQDLHHAVSSLGLYAAPLLELGPARTANALRTWMRLNGAPACHAAQLRTWLAQACSRADASPELCWGGWVLERYRDQWLLHPQLIADWPPQTLNCLIPGQRIDLAGNGVLEVGPEIITAGGGVEPALDPALDWPLERARAGFPLQEVLLARKLVSWTLGRGRGSLRCSALRSGVWQLRARRGGERLLQGGHAHRHTVRNLLQEIGAPRWWRNQVPLLFRDGQLVAIPGVAVAGAVQAGVGEAGVTLRWHPFAT